MVVSVRMRLGGKGEAVRRRLPDGRVIPVCLCYYNADGSNGCVAQVRGDRLQEVVDCGGQYAPGNLDFYIKEGTSDNRCVYCYSNRKNGGKVARRRVSVMTRGDFEKHRPKFLRLGVDTEFGHAYYWPALKELIELANEFGSRLIFPTKMLAFGREGMRGKVCRDMLPRGEEMAELFRQNGGIIHYSIVGDFLEPGAVSQGYANRWRIQQARRYHEAGVHVSLTVSCDMASQSIKENAERGFAVLDALKARDRHGLILRFLPLRFPSRKVALLATGKTWEELVYNPKDRIVDSALPELEEEVRERIRQAENKPYQRRGNNEIEPRLLHPDFKKLIDEGVGVCGEIGDFEFCDKCDLLGNVRIKYPLSEKPKLVYTKGKRPRGRDKERERAPLFD